MRDFDPTPSLREDILAIVPEHIRTARLHEALVNTAPDAYRYIKRKAKDLTSVMDIASPSFQYGNYISQHTLIERAAQGHETSAAIHESVVDTLSDVYFIESMNGINGGLYGLAAAAGATDLEQMFTTLADREHVSRTARAIAVHFNKYGVMDQPLSEIEEGAMTAYLGAILSEDEMTRLTVRHASKRAQKRLEEQYPVYHLLEMLSRKIPEITPYLAQLGDDRDNVLDAFYRYFLITMIGGGLSISPHQVGEYRAAVLDYARSISFNPDITEKLNYAASLVDNVQEEYALPVESLNWEVLPPGELVEKAREIVETHIESTGQWATIDLERLQILVNLREWWGKQHSYYTHGVRDKRRRVVYDDDGKAVVDEYLMLILRRYDEHGNFIGEDAVAESPIAGPNALYIQRYDVNGWDWRELMAYPKNEVRAMGTRRLLHDAAQDEDLIDSMTSKVQALLTSSPEDFPYIEFRGRRRDGSLKTHLARRAFYEL